MQLHCLLCTHSLIKECCAVCRYFTVLSLHLLMTSYLKWGGMSEAELSGWRYARIQSALSEIA
jgi:hypothetical protein